MVRRKAMAAAAPTGRITPSKSAVAITAMLCLQANATGAHWVNLTLMTHVGAELIQRPTQ